MAFLTNFCWLWGQFLQKLLENVVSFPTHSTGIGIANSFWDWVTIGIGTGQYFLKYSIGIGMDQYSFWKY